MYLATFAPLRPMRFAKLLAVTLFGVWPRGAASQSTAASPPASRSAPSDAAQPRAVFGTWRVAQGAVAPWAAADTTQLNREAYLTRAVRLSPTSFSGFAGVFACSSPRYEQTAVPADGLFQGSLPTPAANAARALGFAAGVVRGTRLTCRSGVFEFHAADASHLLVAIDNVIWTLDRSPGALAFATSPAGVVQAFLEQHFAGSMNFDSVAVRRVRPFLSAALTQHIANYLAIPGSPNEAPVIDGDPFTDTQEYPTRFSVQAATVTANRATVVVRLADGYSSRALQYQLHSGAGGWRIDNIRYAGGSTFGDVLRTPLTGADAKDPAAPEWAELAWRKESVARGLVRDSSVMPVMWNADFDGDGRHDIAWVVRHGKTGARGVLIVHASGRAAQQCGAGVLFGNGGDNFDWMDRWQVVPSRSGKGSALLVEKTESASGRIEFRAGRYRWLQVGD